MNRIRQSFLIVLSVVGAVTALPVAAAPEVREWRFTALLDDKEIGHHHFVLTEQGAQRSLKSEARFDVKFLFFNAYRYVHDSDEIWRGQCLSRIDASTDDDGKRYFVRGTREQAKFSIETNRSTEPLPDCVMTFAYWNPQILNATHLLSAQTGEYFDVEVVPLGPDPVAVGGETQPAQRYRLKTNKFAIDLWYSADGEWLALESTTESGRRLRYRLN
jgi:Family of unknown function (DUF6134)